MKDLSDPVDWDALIERMRVEEVDHFNALHEFDEPSKRPEPRRTTFTKESFS